MFQSVDLIILFYYLLYFQKYIWNISDCINQF